MSRRKRRIPGMHISFRLQQGIDLSARTSKAPNAASKTQHYELLHESVVDMQDTPIVAPVRSFHRIRPCQLPHTPTNRFADSQFHRQRPSQHRHRHLGSVKEKAFCRGCPVECLGIFIGKAEGPHERTRGGPIYVVRASQLCAPSSRRTKANFSACSSALADRSRSSWAK